MDDGVTVVKLNDQIKVSRNDIPTQFDSIDNASINDLYLGNGDNNINLGFDSEVNVVATGTGDDSVYLRSASTYHYGGGYDTFHNQKARTLLMSGLDYSDVNQTIINQRNEIYSTYNTGGGQSVNYLSSYNADILLDFGNGNSIEVVGLIVRLNENGDVISRSLNHSRDIIFNDQTSLYWDFSGTSLEYSYSSTPSSNNYMGTVSSETFAGTITGDSIYAFLGNDTVYGGDGNDDINGQQGDDTIYGGNGDDDISGGLGNDIINGDDGEDDINGGIGNDVISGGAGDDIIDGGQGVDTYMWSIGDGNDTFIDFRQNENIIKFGSGITQSDISFGVSSIDNKDLIIKINDEFLTLVDGLDSKGQNLYSYKIEFFDGSIMGIPVNLNYSGTNQGETLWGYLFDDVIYGLDGDDIIDAKSGNDVIYGGLGDDIIKNGYGEDIFYWSPGDGNDTLTSFFYTLQVVFLSTIIIWKQIYFTSLAVLLPKILLFQCYQTVI